MVIWQKNCDTAEKLQPSGPLTKRQQQINMKNTDCGCKAFTLGSNEEHIQIMINAVAIRLALLTTITNPLW